MGLEGGVDEKVALDLHPVAIQDLRIEAMKGARSIEQQIEMIVLDWLYGVMRRMPQAPDDGWRPHKKARRMVTQKMRLEVFSEANGVCFACSGQLFLHHPWHVDHDVPLVKGGDNDPGNLRLLCEKCNTTKGGRTMAEFLGADRS